MTIAALYVQTGGVYCDLPGVEPWGLPERDARGYAGPQHPVIAHPPCARWCMLAHVVQARYGYKVGDDGGMFAAALAAVRRWGGVLEHPAFSKAWKAYNLLRPPTAGGWVPADTVGGWTCHVEQGSYGHPARKATWLYARGADLLPGLRWGKSDATAWVSWMNNHGTNHGKRVGKAVAAATPIPFRDLLIDIAKGCTSNG